jgi:hypothetical protein
MKLKSASSLVRNHLKITFLIAVAIGSCLSASAQGTLAWNWTWSGSWWTGSGTLVTADVLSTDPVGASGNSPFTGYQVLGITGTFTNYPGGVGVGTPSSLSVLSLDATNSFFGSGDNLLSASGIHVDAKGLNFAVSGDHWNLTSGGAAYGIQSASSGGDSFDYFGQGFTVTLLPAPEPSVLALAALGGLGGVCLIRRRK